MKYNNKKKIHKTRLILTPNYFEHNLIYILIHLVIFILKQEAQIKKILFKNVKNIV